MRRCQFIFTALLVVLLFSGGSKAMTVAPNRWTPQNGRTVITYEGGGSRKSILHPQSSILVVCGGNLLIQERDTNVNVLETYTRGPDASGSLQGAGLPRQSAATAGGIGGLLARTDTNGSTFHHADGAGNITALMDGEEIIAARYLYNPFGKLIAQWGPMAPVNAMRFSSMPYYSSPQIYGYLGRFYDPNLQRWLNQDPIGERGGINLYRFCGNDPIDLYDPLGLLFGQGGDAEQNPAGVNGPTSTSYSTPLPGYTPPPQPYTGPWIGPGDPNAPAYTPYNFLPYQGLMDMMGNGSYLTPDQAAAIATPIDFALSMPEARVTCPKFGTTHAAEQAFERGFSPSRITQVLKDGEITPQVSRFGNPQLNFNLGGNQVIIDTTGRNAGKIINTFSDWTPLHGTKGYWSW